MPPRASDENYGTYCMDVKRKTYFGRIYRFTEIGILYEAKCKEARIDQNKKLS
jgi:hypothetical protein